MARAGTKELPATLTLNDNPKNLSYTGAGKVDNYNRHKESLVVMVTLDQSGKQKRQPLFSSFDADVVTCPKVYEEINNNELILFGQRKEDTAICKSYFLISYEVETS